MCAHAEFDCFGRTGGVGHVPMQNFFLWQSIRHLVCAYADFFFGRTGGIGRVPMQTKSVSFLQNEQPCLAFQPPPQNRRPNSADLTDLFRRLVGFLNFADLFCRFFGFL